MWMQMIQWRWGTDRGRCCRMWRIRKEFLKETMPEGAWRIRGQTGGVRGKCAESFWHREQHNQSPGGVQMSKAGIWQPVFAIEKNNAVLDGEWWPSLSPGHTTGGDKRQQSRLHSQWTRFHLQGTYPTKGTSVHLFLTCALKRLNKRKNI